MSRALDESCPVYRALRERSKASGEQMGRTRLLKCSKYLEKRGGHPAHCIDYWVNLVNVYYVLRYRIEFKVRKGRAITDSVERLCWWLANRETLHKRTSRRAGSNQVLSCQGEIPAVTRSGGPKCWEGFANKARQPPIS